MEIRVLQYFLAAAREESITRAAETLHMTQPPLSREIRQLEEDLGKQLFIREKRRLVLTEEGMLLRKRAEEIIQLVEKTEAEIRAQNEGISGDLYIGGGESEGIRLIVRAVKRLQAVYPDVRYHFYSNNAEAISDRLDKGLLDFGIFIGAANTEKYDFIRLPYEDIWGVLMRRDDPLAERTVIRPEDLAGKPICVSQQAQNSNELRGWLGNVSQEPYIAATYNLLFNASIMADEGVAYVLCLDRIVQQGADSRLCFRPLEPALKAGMVLAWKKYQVLSGAAQKFLEQIQQELSIPCESDI